MNIDLISIDPSKKFLNFLEQRVKSENYRGNQLSQHNRYNKEVVILMLKEIFSIVGDELLQIRDTDLSERPYNIDGEEKYAEYVNKITSGKIGRGTQDSIRKNLFVDFNRMGFIDRYSSNKTLNDPFKKSKTKYISLTELGKEIIFERNIFKQNMLYSRGIDNLMRGILDDLLWVILELGKVTEDEYTFFVSYLNVELDGLFYSKDKIIGFVKEYRTLSRHNKLAIRDRLKDHCNPLKFTGNKKQKRDFHNWINETQQVFTLLEQTVFFEKRERTLYAKVGPNAIFENEVKLDRSLVEKKKYHEYHGLEKKSGFELHHIVPLSWAKDRNEFSTLDNHKNLVYIDGFSHAKITQNRNRNVKLDFVMNDATFTDYNNEKVYCKYLDNLLYNPKNQIEMKYFNETILKSIK